jgi:TIR domain
MKFDVFISYSSRDKTAADAACAVLESAGIRCWIAPRDIKPGGEYGAAIISAIERCRVMVLIFSSSANKSHQIHREIERAVSKGVPIVPVRIEEVVPTKSMEYFLGGIHWLDALTPPIEEHLKQLAGTVEAILQADAGSRGKSRKLPPRERASSTMAGEIHHPAKREEGGQDRADAGRDTKLVGIRWGYAMLAAGLCIIAALGGIWFNQTRTPAPASPTSSQPPQRAQKLAALLVPETIPFVRDVDRAAIRSEYLPAPEHKALAISLTRNAFTTGQPDDETAKTAALASCTRATEASGTKYPCEIYAVGNNVVFAGGNPPMPPPPWRVRNPPIETPFASKNLPFVGDGDRAFWEKTYPTAGKPKALALAPRGASFYYGNAVSPEEAIRRALEACGYRSGVACMIIAVDDSFVVPIPTTMNAVGFFLPGSDAAIAPELRADLAQRLGNAPNAWNGVAVGANGKPGLMLNAPDEKAAIEGALTDCGRQDRDCRVIALGPFSVEPLLSSKSVEGSPLPPTKVGPAQRGSPQAPLPPITVGPTPNLRPQ